MGNIATDGFGTIWSFFENATGGTGAGGGGGAGPTGPAGLTARGLWTAGVSYATGDYVSYGGAAYLCVTAVSGSAAPSADTAHWTALNTSVIYQKAGINL